MLSEEIVMKIEILILVNETVSVRYLQKGNCSLNLIVDGRVSSNHH